MDVNTITGHVGITTAIEVLEQHEQPVLEIATYRYLDNVSDDVLETPVPSGAGERIELVRKLYNQHRDELYAYFTKDENTAILRVSSAIVILAHMRGKRGLFDRGINEFFENIGINEEPDFTSLPTLVHTARLEFEDEDIGEYASSELLDSVFHDHVREFHENLIRELLFIFVYENFDAVSKYLDKQGKASDNFSTMIKLRNREDVSNRTPTKVVLPIVAGYPRELVDLIPTHYEHQVKRRLLDSYAYLMTHDVSNDADEWVSETEEDVQEGMNYPYAAYVALHRDVDVSESQRREAARELAER